MIFLKSTESSVFSSVLIVSVGYINITVRRIIGLKTVSNSGSHCSLSLYHCETKEAKLCLPYKFTGHILYDLFDSNFHLKKISVKNDDK